MSVDQLRVAVAQPVVTALDLAANVRAHAGLVRRAAARLVVFPELSLTGYELAAPPLDPADPCLDELRAACAETGSVALVGAPIEEGGRAHIAVLRVDAVCVGVAYRKTSLGAAEQPRFSPGPGPVAIDVDGWRVGIGICKDTGDADHVTATAALGLDLYAAGVVHHPWELDEQQARARRIAAATGAPVALASCAGATGGGFAATAGRSSISDRHGDVLVEAGADADEVVTTLLTRGRASSRPGARG